MMSEPLALWSWQLQEAGLKLVNLHNAVMHNL
jgi:hypothetical protein